MSLKYEPASVQAFMGAGNVLPIWRGGGIDQPLFHDFARQVREGGRETLNPKHRRENP